MIQTKNLKILIADDDDASAFFLATITEKYSKEVVIAKNGAEAVDACRNNPDIDLVLMDIQMPEMNGYEATSKIREFNNSVVILVQTAFDLPENIEKAKQVGSNDFIAKPVDKNLLSKMIERFF
jgi:CheY-like chemotaxis protein